jgi:hypothetical protein
MTVISRRGDYQGRESVMSLRENDEKDNATMEDEMQGGSDWRAFLKRHWAAVAVFVVAGCLAFAGAVYVILWFVSNAQSTGLVPSSLGSWTMGNLLSFTIYSIFYELLLVGIPVAIGGIAGWMWWRRLPYAERAGYDFGRSKSAGGGGGVSLLLFIVFCAKVYLDGNWNVAISTFSLNYVVDSMLTILVWGLVIIGIPVAIGSIWWVRHEIKRA